MKPYGFVLIAALTTAPQLAHAFFDAPYVVPASPNAGELVSVHIRGGGCDTIIDREGYPQITQEGSAVRMLFFSVHEDQIDWCIYGEGEAAFPVGVFPSGSYSLQVDRVYETLFGDVAETFGVVPFVVRGSASAAESVPSGSPWAALALASVIVLIGAHRVQSTIRFG